MADDGPGPYHYLVAQLYQRAGRRSMSENELANAASLDLKWYPPKQARQLVAGLVRAGYLDRDEDGELTPSFDAKAIKVPLGFKPDSRLPNELPPAGNIEIQADPPKPAGVPAPRRSTADRPPAPNASPTLHEAARSGRKAAAEQAQQPEPEEPPADDVTPGTLPHILQVLTERSGEEAPVWVQRMEAVAQRNGDVLAPEAALLLAAAQAGCEVRDLAAVVRDRPA